MSRRKRRTPADEARDAMRRAKRAEYVEALRDGRKERASTFTDRRKEASRTACRGQVV